MIGLGVMIRQLAGNEKSVEAYKKALGQKITALTLDADKGLYFTFESGYRMRLFDDGQSCCETRYMTTDDDLAAFVGADLRDVEIRDVDDRPAEYSGEVHEVQFLLVNTSIGTFTCETHNEHNGYYGGFLVKAEELE